MSLSLSRATDPDHRATQEAHDLGRFVSQAMEQARQIGDWENYLNGFALFRSFWDKACEEQAKLDQKVSSIAKLVSDKPRDVKNIDVWTLTEIASLATSVATRRKGQDLMQFMARGWNRDFASIACCETLKAVYFSIPWIDKKEALQIVGTLIPVLRKTPSFMLPMLSTLAQNDIRSMPRFTSSEPVVVECHSALIQTVKTAGYYADDAGFEAKRILRYMASRHPVRSLQKQAHEARRTLVCNRLVP